MSARGVACVALVALAAACGASGPTPPPVRPGEQADRYTEVSVPGLTLWTVHGAVEDHEWSSVVGMDASGNVVPSEQVFLRAVTPGQPVDTVVRRAQAILGVQGNVLRTAEDAGQWGTPEEKALIVPPVVDRGVLTVWMLAGEMHPDITRVKITLATAAVASDSASSLVPQAPPTAPPPPPGPQVPGPMDVAGS